jgi:Cu(I)/Ag(I) efflux system membrane fusion protein
MRVYSSALSAAAAAYITDLGLRDTGTLPANRGARQRLENLGVPEGIIMEIERSRQGSLTVTWPAPQDGYVVEHNVVEGMQAKAGDILFRIADLSAIWVLADVAEHDLNLIAPGQAVTVTPRGYPGRTFTGKISLIYPMLNKETRTVRVRIELANPDGILRPNMYADAVIASGSGAKVLAVPESAIINSGTRQYVIRDQGGGRFEPRTVKTAMHGDGYVEIREGVSDGDKVVTAANFLIDAESNLKAALQSLAAGDVQ